MYGRLRGRSGPGLVVGGATLLVSLVAAACGGGGGSAGGQGQPEATISVAGESAAVSRLTDAVDGLCEARRQASNPEAAEATFYEGTHETLHLIARLLEGVDRARAASLLEAKQRVEADLAGFASEARLVEDLSELIEATRSGLGRLAVQVPPCAK